MMHFGQSPGLWSLALHLQILSGFHHARIPLPFLPGPPAGADKPPLVALVVVVYGEVIALLSPPSQANVCPPCVGLDKHSPGICSFRNRGMHSWLCCIFFFCSPRTHIHSTTGTSFEVDPQVTTTPFQSSVWSNNRIDIQLVPLHWDRKITGVLQSQPGGTQSQAFQNYH